MAAPNYGADGSHRTPRWSKGDSNRRSPGAGSITKRNSFLREACSPNQFRNGAVALFMIPGQALACPCSVAVDVAKSFPSRSWIRPARRWRCTAIPTWFGRSPGHAAYSSCRVLPVARARTRSLRPELRGLGSPPADLFVAALGPLRPRVALETFAAKPDLGLRADGVLPTRVSTRSAVSRSVN